MTVMLSLAIVLVLGVAAASSLDVDPRFTEATKAFRDLEYESALAKFDELASDPKHDDELPRILLWAGATRALLGDEVAARFAFEGALRRDPSAKLEVRVSSKVAAILEDVRAKMPSTPVVATPSEPSPAAARSEPGTPSQSARNAPSEASTPSHSASNPPSEAGTTTKRVSKRVDVDDNVAAPAAGNGLSPWTAVALVSGALGVAAAIPSAMLGADAFAKQGQAEDPRTSQIDAAELNKAANDNITLAIALGATAALLVVVAGTTGAAALSP